MFFGTGVSCGYLMIEHSTNEYSAGITSIGAKHFEEKNRPFLAALKSGYKTKSSVNVPACPWKEECVSNLTQHNIWDIWLSFVTSISLKLTQY